METCVKSRRVFLVSKAVDASFNGSLFGQEASVIISENDIISSIDTDNDGVTNDIDQCPDTPTGETSDENGCSDSQNDTDNDGITDDIDQCPNTLAAALVDVNGCEVFTLPVQNFKVEVGSVLCR